MSCQHQARHGLARHLGSMILPKNLAYLLYTKWCQTFGKTADILAVQENLDAHALSARYRHHD